MTDALYDIPLKAIDGGAATLGDYRGKVLLVVNVASKCGLTPQYEGLENLYRDKRDQGLEVLGFPANNFGGQEPGTEAEIADFCSLTFGVDFPMFAKISVKGEDISPLYAELIAQAPKAEGADAMRQKLAGYGIPGGDERDILWNFEKFVVGRDGKVVARFSPDVTANDPRLLEALDGALEA